MKHKIAIKAHKRQNKPYLKGRTLSAFTDDEKSKNPMKVISAEYYLYTHFFGEDLHDDDEDESDAASNLHREGNFESSSFIGKFMKINLF